MRRVATAAVLLFLTSGAPVAAEDRPTSDQPWTAGAYHLARGNYQDALASLSGAIPDRTSSAAALNVRGIAEMMNGQYANALDSFRLALETDPTLIEARFNRGVTWLRMRKFDRAAGEFSQVWDNGTQLKAAAAFHHALADDGAGKPEQAAKWLEKALTADASFDDARLYLGVIRENQGELQAAGRAYHDYLARHPESVVVRLRFGITSLAAGNIETAKKYLKDVVTMAPGSPEAVEANKFLVMWE